MNDQKGRSARSAREKKPKDSPPPTLANQLDAASKRLVAWPVSGLLRRAATAMRKIERDLIATVDNLTLELEEVRAGRDAAETRARCFETLAAESTAALAQSNKMHESEVSRLERMHERQLTDIAGSIMDGVNPMAENISRANQAMSEIREAVIILSHKHPSAEGRETRERILAAVEKYWAPQDGA